MCYALVHLWHADLSYALLLMWHYGPGPRPYWVGPHAH